MPDPVSSSISCRNVYSYDPDKDVGMRDAIVKGADEQTYGVNRHAFAAFGIAVAFVLSRKLLNF